MQGNPVPLKFVSWLQGILEITCHSYTTECKNPIALYYSFRSQYSDLIWFNKWFSSLGWILRAMNKSSWRQNPAYYWEELPLNKPQKLIFGKQGLLLGFHIYTPMLLRIHAVRFSHSSAKLVNFARLELATPAIFSIQWSQEVWKPGNCFPLKYVVDNSHMQCSRYGQKSALLSWMRTGPPATLTFSRTGWLKF